MDFDNPKVYGDTSITDGLVSFSVPFQRVIELLFVRSKIILGPPSGKFILRFFFLQKDRTFSKYLLDPGDVVAVVGAVAKFV